MNERNEIAQRVLNDINYIPSLDELRILGHDFSIGASPVFTLTLHSNFQSTYEAQYKLISKNCIHGTSELYSQLLSGKCDTYSEERLFFVAYELSKYNITFDLSGFEYRNKLNKKFAEIDRLIKILESEK